IVSGLVTWPCDHERIFSGEARLMRIASKSGVSVFSPVYLIISLIPSSKNPWKRQAIGLIGPIGLIGLIGHPIGPISPIMINFLAHRASATRRRGRAIAIRAQAR